MKSFFEPPLWFERRTLILKILNEHKNIKKVIDYGCNVGNLLEVLINNSEYEEIIGVDCDEKVLNEAYEKCKVSKYFEEYMKTSPLNVKLLKGNIKFSDKRLLNSDALICSEVIEHLDAETLNIFPEIIFNKYKPKLVIVTTPNIEFNYYFKELNYGQPNQKYRHEEHLFEWTREEFKSWVEDISKKYKYDYSITGVGEAPKEKMDGDRGFCTQVAIFDRKETVDNNSCEPLEEQFECLYNIDYPYLDNSKISVDEILKELIIFSKCFIERNELDLKQELNNANDIDDEGIENENLHNENIENENIDNKDIKKKANGNEIVSPTENNDKKSLTEKSPKNENEISNNKYSCSIELDRMWNDYYINRLCSSKEKLIEVFNDDKVRDIFYYDKKQPGTVHVRNIGDIFKYYDEYYPKQPSSEEFEDNYSDDDYNNNKYTDDNKYTDEESKDDSFWDNYSDYHIDNEFSS